MSRSRLESPALGGVWTLLIYGLPLSIQRQYQRLQMESSLRRVRAMACYWSGSQPAEQFYVPVRDRAWIELSDIVPLQPLTLGAVDANYQFQCLLSDERATQQSLCEGVSVDWAGDHVHESPDLIHANGRALSLSHFCGQLCDRSQGVAPVSLAGAVALNLDFLAETQRAGSDQGWVLWLCPQQISQPKQVHSWLQHQFQQPANLHSGFPAPAAIAWVSSIPRLGSGQVDWNLLLALPRYSLSELAERSVSIQVPSTEPAAGSHWHFASVDAHYRTHWLQPEFGTPTEDELEANSASSYQQLVNAETLDERQTQYSLGQMLQRTAQQFPTHYIEFLTAQDQALERISYQQLWRRAVRGAQGLMAAFPKAKALVVIADNDRDLILGFWSAQLAGLPILSMLAKPAATVLTEAQQHCLGEACSRLTDVLIVGAANLMPAITASVQDQALAAIRVAQLQTQLDDDGVDYSPTDESLASELPGLNPAQTQPQDLALWLLTSGSSGHSKWVMQSHQAVLYQNLAAAAVLKVTSSDHCLNWMPLDHVGGIIMSHCMFMLHGANQLLVATDTILESPIRLLDLFSHYGITFSWAPNFAYALISQAVQQGSEENNPSWDLSALKTLINGGESVTADTCRQFYQALAPFGLAKGVITPAWGMSETCSITLIHTDYDPFQSDRVSVGSPVAGVSFRVSEPQQQLQIKAPCVSMGYFGTQMPIDADGWFEVGDLASIDQGQVTILGRDTDKLVLQGLNLSSLEVESTLHNLPGVRHGYCVVAATRFVADPSDSLVVILGLPPGGVDASTLNDIRRTVLSAHGVSVRWIVPIPEQQFARTAIGKPKRKLLVQQLLAGAFDDCLMAAETLLGTDHTAPQWNFKPSWQATAVTSASPLCWQLLWPEQEPVAESLLELATQRHEVACSGADWDWSAVNLSSDERPVLWPIMAFAPAQQTLEQALVWLVQQLQQLVPRLQSETQKPKRLFILVTSGVFHGVGHSVDHGSVHGSVHGSAGYDSSCYALQALLQSIQQENPGVRIQLVEDDQWSPALLQQVLNEPEFPTVSRLYLGERQVPALTKVQVQLPLDKGAETVPPAPFNGDERSVLILAGGAGGLGQALLPALLRFCRSRMLIVGRRSEAEVLSVEPTISALFRQHPQRLAYWQADLSEPDALAELSPYLEQRWPGKSKVIGGLQLIADFYSGMMLDQSTTDNLADIEQLLTTKRISSENLHQWSLQQQQPQTWIHFGSVNGWFGAAFYGVYAAASGIQLQQVNHWQQEFQAKQHGVNHFWLGWSLWRGLGVSAHLADSQQQLARKQGYFALTPTSSWASMLAALEQGEQQLLIGLNEKAFPMQHQIKADGDHPVLDLLSFAQQHKAATNQPKRAPQTPLEESIHGLWCDLLEQADIGIDDNFFTLGGHSLVAAQVTQQLQQQLQRRVPVALFFEHPTIAQLAKALGNQTQVPNSQLPPLLLEPIPVVTQRQRIQPSAAQQRLLFLQQLEGDRPTFNIPFGIVVESAMEQAVLQQALDDVVARHRLLHSHFEMAEGSFWLVEDEYQQYPIRVRDLSTSERPMEDAQVLFETMANRNFQLDRAPLFSVELLLLGTQRCALIANAHHTIFDGWSVGVLMNELMASYRHRKTGAASSLPPLEIQYLDFVAWQDQWLNSEELAQQRNYWLQQLQGMPTKLALPTDFPRPPIMAHIGDERHFVVAPALYQRLTQFCEQHNFTLNMVLMAAYGLLLGRYSGQQDLAVGTAVANRRHPQTEALIGMFVNTLVIRHQIAPQNSAQAHLAQMKQTMLAALANEDYPFEQLVEGLQPERDLSSTPLFQAFFVLQNAPLGQSDFSDIEVKPMLRRSTIAKFDLSLQMVELQGELLGGLEFNREVFAGETIERFIQQFQVLLQALLDQPELPVSQLNMQTPAESARDQQWQASTKPLTPAKTVWQRLSQHAQQTPHALALQGDGDELSYLQLVERTQQWGAYWQQQGVKPGDNVAVLLPRSVDQVVALLSIMYCGACHVPVDPSYPRQRVQYMLQHCAPRLVVSNADIIQQVDAPDLAWQDVQQIDASLQPQLGVNTDIDLPLYVIYTSGSTGNPKGVEIAQRSMLNLIDFCEQEIRVQPGDSWFAVGSMSFDAAALDLFLPLTQGAKLVLTTQDQVLDAPWLNRTVLQQPGASFMLGTPSIWEHLSQGDWPGCPKLTIMSGGESLKLKLAAKLLAGIDRLFNVYGPTEGTVWATTHQVTELDQRPVPIGKPLTNVRVQVLDQLGQPVLTGVPGELFIGGACVGLGYLSDPANTAKSFVMLPEADGTESRWYRTGDQVRWRDDGLLEFIGRIDHQVKVRGYRIELGEVEQGLLAQSGVQQAMAEVVPHPQQDNILVAYVQSDQADRLDAKTLKTALAERLPHFMLPSHILICSEYPLTPNGKVDTKALASQVISAAPLAGDRVEPSTDNERQMLAIWQQVLGHDNIGVTDSFFDAGGNSVLVIQLVHRIQQQFGKAVPVTQLFRLGTIAAMVDYIEQDIDPKDTEFDPASTLVCLQSGRADQTPLVLVHAVNGKADVYAMLAHLMPEEQPIYCLQMPATESDDVSLTSIDGFAQHYLAELDQRFPGRPLLLGGWSFGGLVAFAMAQRLALQNRPCKGLLMIESSHPDVLRSKKPMSESMVLLLAGVGLGLQLYQIPTELYLMEDEQSALQALLDRLQALQLVTEDFGIEDVIAQRDLIRKNEKAFVEFESQDVVLAGPALVITASSQPKERTPSEDLGWGPHIHSLDVVRVEGDHITVMQPPGLNRTVQQVTQWLQQQ